MRPARTVAVALLAASLAAVVAAPVSAGGKPDRSQQPAPPLELPGGPDGYCEFPVLIENIVDRTTTTVFPADRDGTVRTRFTGFVRVRVTNLDTGESLERVLNGAITLREWADGRVTFSFSGPVIAFYTAADETVSDIPRGVWYVRGHGEEAYAADGSLQEAWAVGRRIDLCAALAG